MVLFALIAIQDMKLKQLDVKTTFLHGLLEEDILIHDHKALWSIIRKGCV